MRVGPREALLLATLVAFPLASYFLAFEPRNTEIEKAKDEIKHKRAMLQKVKESSARKETLEKQIADTKEKIRLIEAKLPSRKEVDAIVRSISDLAVSSGLNPPNVESQKPINAGNYMEQPLKIEVSGPFRAEDGKGFNAFIVALEKLERITRIPDMKVTRSKDNNGHINAEFTLSIYFLPEGGAQ